MNYVEFTNKELKEVCDEVELEFPEAKNPSKPNKTEMITALQKHDGTWISPKEEASIAAEAEEVQKALGATKSTPLTKRQKQRQIKRSKMALQHVIITSNDRSVTHKMKNVVYYFGWGNSGFLGYQNDKAIMGKPWHVRQGALDRLEDMVLSIPFQPEGSNRIEYEVIPAFTVQRLNQLTEDERRIIGKRQQIRDENMGNMSTV